MTMDGIDAVRLRGAVDAALASWRTTAPPGTLRLLFVAAPADVRAGYDLPEPADGFDDLYVRDIVSQVERIATRGAVIALARPEARPLRRDRVLCRAVAGRLQDSPVQLVDFLTVGATCDWSMINRRRRTVATAAPA